MGTKTSFSATLWEGAAYYVAIKAYNADRSSDYSNIELFTLTAASTGGTTVTDTVTDIDGNVYNTVTIGTQVWMKEDLKVTKYRNGDAIGMTTADDITHDTSSKYQWAYNYDLSGRRKRGRRQDEGSRNNALGWY